MSGGHVSIAWDDRVASRRDNTSSEEVVHSSPACLAGCCCRFVCGRSHRRQHGAGDAHEVAFSVYFPGLLVASSSDALLACTNGNRNKWGAGYMQRSTKKNGK